MENKKTVVVLDGSVDINHPYLQNKNLSIYRYKNIGYWEEENLEHTPDNGHGTAVCGIISKNSNDINIIVFDILGYELKADVDTLVSALTYVFSNIDCDIINMSLGIRSINTKLESICRKLYEKGAILVAAFDNAGAISYPAAYPFVIGVDTSLRCTHNDDFVYVENSIVNIRAKGGNQRVAWVNPSYIINQGSSFAAPYVTAYLTKLEINKLPDIYEHFKTISRFAYINPVSTNEHMRKSRININKAALFPCNKEMHSLLNFPELLDFEICNVYDHKYSGNVGLLYSNLNKTCTYKILNIDECDWSTIDTLIIGHVSEFEAYSGNNIKKEIIEKCINKKINIFSFDNEWVRDLKHNEISILWPSKNEENFTFNKFGKLHKIKAPVLGVFGTTKKQGKFTLQLQLRKKFINAGYSVCQLGTEPSSELFGMDEVYPFGYSGTLKLGCYESIEYVNSLMNRMDTKDPEIIIVGSQSGTIPMLFDNLGQIPMDQIAFFLGTNPDAVILCVNIYDDIQYINRTISCLESLSECKVIAVAIYPMHFENGWSILSNTKKRATDELISRFKETIMENMHLNSFVIGDLSEEDSLFLTCIDYFS